MNINGIDIKVERKPIKHIHLSVYPPDGRVHISTPQTTSDEQIRMFVLSKWVWLIEKREAATSHHILPPREYVSGEAHYYKGELYRLRVDVNQGEEQNVCIEGDYIVVCCRRKKNAEGLLKDWYRARLNEILNSLIKKWSERLSFAMPEWEVLSMPGRWGSCNQAQRRIMFNPDLAKKPLACIEYIVAHEMVHLLERTHTDRFYRLLDTHMPGWEKLKDELNEMPITL